MKSFVLVFALLTTNVAAAQTVTAPTSLSAAMRSMATAFKALSARANDPSANESSADLAEQFARAALDSKSFVPESLADLPASELAPRKAAFDRMLDETAAIALHLAEAFRQNDNAKAAELLKLLADARSAGHGEFR